MALRSDYPVTKLLLLGTFHFEDARRDLYKPQFNLDVFSPKTQEEIEAVLERLARFQPTKIALEVDVPRQAELDGTYSAFTQGAFRLSGNEIHQLGFRLARRLGHPRVYAVNAWGRLYEPPVDFDRPSAPGERAFNPYEDLERYAHEHAQAHLLSEWQEAYRAFYREADEAKIARPLRETLLWMNRPETLRTYHGHYLVGQFKLGTAEAYPGVDFITSWYSRNLRIFANVQRITEPPDERLLLVIGAGHVPILRHCAEASPEYELAEVADYL